MRVLTSSTAPSGSSPSWNGPNDTRISRLTCRPSARSTFLISRFLPSRIAKVIQTLEPCSRSSVASIAPYWMPSTSMPFLSPSSCACVTLPNARTR